jgi:hypothetical protein
VADQTRCRRCGRVECKVPLVTSGALKHDDNCRPVCCPACAAVEDCNDHPEVDWLARYLTAEATIEEQQQENARATELVVGLRADVARIIEERAAAVQREAEAVAENKREGDARVAGIEAFEAGKDLYDGPATCGPDGFLGDCWVTGWRIGEAKTLRAKLDKALNERDAARKHAESAAAERDLVKFGDDPHGIGRKLTKENIDLRRERDAARKREAEGVEANRKLRREVTIAQEAARRRNLEIDALHYVWCDGGCASGTHRFEHRQPLSEEIVELAVRNTDRLVKWWRNKEYKAAWKLAPDHLRQQLNEAWTARAEAVARVETAERERDIARAVVPSEALRDADQRVDGFRVALADSERKRGEVERGAAAMRGVLEYMVERDIVPENLNVRGVHTDLLRQCPKCRTEDALKSTAGLDYVPRAELETQIERLRLREVVVDKLGRGLCIEPGCGEPARHHCYRHLGGIGGGESAKAPTGEGK